MRGSPAYGKTQPARLLPWLLPLLLLFGCQGVPQRTDLDFGQGERNWAAFVELSRKNEAASPPFNSVLNIRYKSPRDSHRFTAYFWGNGGAAPQPVRLDIQGAFGATAAKLFEDERSFILYDTDKNVAYVSDGTARTMLRLGLPLPVRLGDLALLFNGFYTGFFLPGQTASATMPKLIASNSRQESTYLLADGPRPGELTVDGRGRPVQWSESGGKGWLFEFAYLDGTQAESLPGIYRLQASHPEGYSVNIQIKSYNRRDKAYTPDQLELLLPRDAVVKNS